MSEARPREPVRERPGHQAQSLVMVRATLDDVPEAALPAPFALRFYRAGDEAHWLRIHLEADVLNTFAEATFRAQFGENDAELAARQWYLVDGEGEPIGTSTAWQGDPPMAARRAVGEGEGDDGAAWGRVHWVAILPGWQGRGLAKPLLAATLRTLRDLGHRRAYLTTSPARIEALELYRRFGFVLAPADSEN